MAAIKNKSTPDVPDFFPEIKGDLSKVTWSHATNSIDKLNAAVLDGMEKSAPLFQKYSNAKTIRRSYDDARS